MLEYLEGQTLAQRLRKGPLPLDQALEFAAQIADALARAHRSGIVHRDLKPANVMLTTDGGVRRGSPQVKLLDFAGSLPSRQPPRASSRPASAPPGAVPGPA